MGINVRVRDLIIVGGAGLVAIIVLAVWTQAWFFATILGAGLAGLAGARVAFVRMPEDAPPPPRVTPVFTEPEGTQANAGSIVQLAGLIEGMPDPIIIADRDGRIVAGNTALVRTFGPAEPRKHIANVIRAPVVLEALDAVLVGAAPRSVEFTVMSSPEQSFSAHVAGAGAPGHKPELAMIMLQDITKAKRIEDMRADFVANASHELRTPLASLTGFIDTLRGAAKDDPAARDRFLGIMSEQASRMRRLIDDLLSLSRIELNEHIKPAGQVNLGDVAEEVSSALMPQAARQEMTITVEEPATMPHAAGDREEIVQVVTNLLDNAIKYGKRGGKVRIELGMRRAEPGEPGPSPAVFVTVQDDGEGIMREHIPRLTERFYRVDVRRSREVGGTGLGLAIVKHIVNRHRGRMLVESKPGEGSSFTVLFPLGTVGASEAGEPPKLAAVVSQKQDHPQEM
jgi:two-component system, OmpR family, phosphate regulon sensor histidine kinase PhoR